MRSPNVNLLGEKRKKEKKEAESLRNIRILKLKRKGTCKSDYKKVTREIGEGNEWCGNRTEIKSIPTREVVTSQGLMLLRDQIRR